MKKTAFTMIELVFVIVIVGIMAAMIIPRLDRDNRFEAANQVLNHIKYTQHLAMTEDVYNHQLVGWWRGRWQIQFFAAGCYAVSRDIGLNGGPPARGDAAFDPQTGKLLYSAAGCAMPMANTDYEKMNLFGYYDVNGVALAGGCNTLTLAFDTLGRPYDDLSVATGVNGVINQDCNITLSFNNGANEIITVRAETGYACILNTAGTNCL